MTGPWGAKLRALSLDHLYLVDAPPAGAPPPHLVWQSPLVLAPPGEPLDKLAARVRRAGELWLVNQDFRPHQQLVIAHVELMWFMAFLRATEPDQAHLWIGPLERRVLRPGDGEPLFGLPLCYRESAHATSRGLWAQLADR